MPILATRHEQIPTQDILSWIFDHISYDWDAPLYIDALDPSKSISARQAQSFIRKLTAGFRANGLRKGDTVCVHAFNSIYYPIFVLGIIAVGGVWTGTNPGYTPLELGHHISVTKAKFFVVGEECLSSLVAAIKSKGIKDAKIFILHDPSSPLPKSGQRYPSWTTLLEHGEKDWERFNDETQAKETTAALMTTSGTTGLPKAAMISHYNFIAEHTLTWELPSLHPSKDWHMRTLVALPMFHAAMAPLAHTSILRGGYECYVMRRFEVEGYMRAVCRFKVNEVVIVPPVVLRCVMHPLAGKGEFDLKSLRRGWCGAAPLDRELQGRFEKLTGGIVTQAWGMTESSCIVSLVPPSERDPSGSVGYLLPNTDIKFLDDDDHEISPAGGSSAGGSEEGASERRGEMCVRGPTIIRGYFDNPLANARDFDTDGYYHTGDVGYMEKGTGKIFIVDRKKELIKVRGFQVAPNEVEGVILGHPGVVDAAVVGLTVPEVPDAEIVRAYVVRREGSDVGAEEIRGLVGRSLARYKQLTGGVNFVDAIPKTASGKILKRVLREEAMRERKAEGAKL